MYVVVETETTSVYGPFETFEAAIDAGFKSEVTDIGRDGHEDYERYWREKHRKGPWTRSKEDFLYRRGLVVRDVLRPDDM